METKEYQELAGRTNDRKNTERLANVLIVPNGNHEHLGEIGGLLNGCLGLSGECGEFCDIVKKAIFHEKFFDEEHAKKELGDVLWYVVMICDSLGWKLEDVMQLNIDKLKARYPEGFDINRANNRKEGDI